MLALRYRYLKRFDEEVEQINLKQSICKNRSNQHASRLSIIKMTLDRENAEYNGAGIGEFVIILHETLTLGRRYSMHKFMVNG